MVTVNSKIFARVLFSQNGEIILLFTDIDNSCPSPVFTVSNVYFNGICKKFQVYSKNLPVAKVYNPPRYPFYCNIDYFNHGN